MELLDVELYKEDIRKVSNLELEWNRLKNKSIMISGASGMIGSFLIDLLMYMNKEKNLNCTILALGRNFEKAKIRFKLHWNSKYFKFIVCDINKGIVLEDKKVDYIFHAASNTHPVEYATDPIGTITTNIIGTYNLLEFATVSDTKRFIFASSVEVYGENRGDIDKYDEKYCGYIDSNTLRAGYPESKRAGEALCQAYIKQRGLDIVIPRLSRTFGPTMQMSDTKAISQFIKNSVEEKDIIIKSKGNQLYSYNYVADVITGILICLFNGECGEAYNISDNDSDITLKELAILLAEYTNKKVAFESPNSVESSGYSKATKAIMDSSKLISIGWKPIYNIKDGLIRTVNILKEVKE